MENAGTRVWVTMGGYGFREAVVRKVTVKFAHLDFYRKGLKVGQGKREWGQVLPWNKGVKPKAGRAK